MQALNARLLSFTLLLKSLKFRAAKVQHLALWDRWCETLKWIGPCQAHLSVNVWFRLSERAPTLLAVQGQPGLVV